MQNNKETAKRASQQKSQPSKSVEIKNLEPARYTYDGGYASLDKNRQIQVGLKIFNEALKGKK